MHYLNKTKTKTTKASSTKNMYKVKTNTPNRGKKKQASDAKCNNLLTPPCLNHTLSSMWAHQNKREGSSRDQN